jgi:hypothetical protein
LVTNFYISISNWSYSRSYSLFNYKNIYGFTIAITLIILGLIGGILMAENIRKKVGLLFFSPTPFKKEKKTKEKKE